MLPPLTSKVVGVYTVFNEVLFGVNVPEPFVLQVAEDAVPPKVPDRLIRLESQTVVSIPAFAVGPGKKLKTNVSEVYKQDEVGTLAVYEITADPLA